LEDRSHVEPKVERMTPADTQSLKDAVARCGPAVLSLPTADGPLRHHRTRFLIPEEQEGFWIEAPQGERQLIDELLAAKKPVGVSVKTGFNKIIFTTLIHQFEAALPVNETNTVDALLLAWPDQVQAIQRRNDYRVTVQPGDADVHLRVWRIGERHHLRDKPPAGDTITVALRDLSVGGMGLIYTPDPDATDDAARLPDNQRLRILLSHGKGEDQLLEGRVLHSRAVPAGNYRLGVQFKNLADDIDGRQTLAALTQIVGQLQRTEIRRKRIALSKKSA
jgi:c-di-GMP-binding flagellar brake protein YcgR